jgi:hypothetical protein
MLVVSLCKRSLNSSLKPLGTCSSLFFRETPAAILPIQHINHEDYPQENSGCFLKHLFLKLSEEWSVPYAKIRPDIGFHVTSMPYLFLQDEANTQPDVDIWIMSTGETDMKIYSIPCALLGKMFEVLD